MEMSQMLPFILKYIRSNTVNYIYYKNNTNLMQIVKYTSSETCEKKNTLYGLSKY